MGMTPRRIFAGARIVAGGFGVVFATMGGTLAFAVWFSDAFDGAPIFIKIPFTAGGLLFLTIGVLLLIQAITNAGPLGAAESVAQRAMDEMESQADTPATNRFAGPGNYVCPHCGGKLTRAEVSPMGDVKCTFCGAWFNIHGKS